MAVQTVEQTPAAILNRIDIILNELLTLRQDVQSLVQDQSWFWTSTWQEMETEAEQDLREGEYRTFDDVETFIQFLDSEAKV